MLRMKEKLGGGEVVSRDWGWEEEGQAENDDQGREKQKFASTHGELAHSAPLPWHLQAFCKLRPSPNDSDTLSPASLWWHSASGEQSTLSSHKIDKIQWITEKRQREQSKSLLTYCSTARLSGTYYRILYR